MRYLIAGAGAIGAYIGARMAQAGFDVTLFARGPHLRAMQEHGVQVKSAEGDFLARPTITGSMEEIGPVDVVFLGVKAHGLPQLAPHLKPVLGPDTTVVSTQNGIPWWYFQGFGGEWDGLRLERVDPGGVISSVIEARRVVGTIVYFATNHRSWRDPTYRGQSVYAWRARWLALRAHPPAGRGAHRIRFALPYQHSPAARDLGETSGQRLSESGQRADPCHHRSNGARPGSSFCDSQHHAGSRSSLHKLGMELPISIDQRIAGAEKVGEHKTSMLQDLEAGRPMELEALVGAVVELGERVGLPMPATRTVYNCAKLLAQSTSTTLASRAQ